MCDLRSGKGKTALGVWHPSGKNSLGVYYVNVAHAVRVLGASAACYVYTAAKFLNENEFLLIWQLNPPLALVLQKFYFQFFTESMNAALTPWLRYEI
jgi:hypothetical protein